MYMWPFFRLPLFYDFVIPFSTTFTVLDEKSLLTFDPVSALISKQDGVLRLACPHRWRQQLHRLLERCRVEIGQQGDLGCRYGCGRRG